MKRFIKRLYKKFFTCEHNLALIHCNEGYCPDCGKLLKKSYYIIRCSVCDIKRKAKCSYDEIVPQEKFCTNCGAKSYIVEKYDSLNFVDINYAIEKKEVVDKKEKDTDFEIWVEKEEIEENKKPLLIPLQLKYIELKN